jgi:hypothetical protein
MLVKKFVFQTFLGLSAAAAAAAEVSLPCTVHALTYVYRIYYIFPSFLLSFSSGKEIKKHPSLTCLSVCSLSLSHSLTLSLSLSLSLSLFLSLSHTHSLSLLSLSLSLSLFLSLSLSQHVAISSTNQPNTFLQNKSFSLL